MSTKSYICVADSSSTALCIYSHMDGDPQYMKKMLERYYSDLEFALKLVKGGDIKYISGDLQEVETERYKPQTGPKYISNRLMNLLDGVDYLYYMGKKGEWFYADREMQEWQPL